MPPSPHALPRLRVATHQMSRLRAAAPDLSRYRAVPPEQPRHREAPPKLPLTFLAAFCAGMVAPPPVVAQAAPKATPLAQITTSATRTERRIDAEPGTVTVITAGDAEARGVRYPKDLFRYEVDLAVRTARHHFEAALGTGGFSGHEGIGIRRLDRNQVLTLVDRVRVPRAFNAGAFLPAPCGSDAAEVWVDFPVRFARAGWTLCATGNIPEKPI